MMVRQISRKEALELAAHGCEILTMVPDITEPGSWRGYMPGTLDGLLEGCLFFKEVPAMENNLLQEAAEIPPGKQNVESRDGSRRDTEETEGAAEKRPGGSV